VWLENVKLKSDVKDEHVTHVEGVGGRRDLANDGLVQFSLDVEETRLVFLGLYVLESGFNTTLKNFELVEKFEERVGFTSLDFTVLNRQAIEEVVEFDSLVGSSTSLIKSRVLSEPEVNIVQQFVLFLYVWSTMYESPE